MDTHSLRAFISVAETRSFTETAETLFLTQPAVSRRISVLEESLGTQLFDRMGKTVKLTPAGEKILPIAQQILAQEEDMKNVVNNLSNHISGKLTLATSHHIGLHRLPDILRRYAKQYPNVELDIRFTDSEVACQQLQQGLLDLAIVTLPQDIPHKLSIETLWIDTLQVVTTDNHPLTQTDNPTIKQVIDFPAVLPSSNTYTRRILDEFIRKNQLKLKVAMETNYLETLAMLTSVGIGWSLLPDTLANAQQLHKVIIKDFSLQRKLGIVSHQSRTLSHAAMAMTHLCKETLE